MTKPNVLTDPNHSKFQNSKTQGVGGTHSDPQNSSTAGNDVLFGTPGDDWLIGGLGADRMVGGKGHDFYIVDNVGDTVVERHGAGRDWMNNGERADWVFVQGSFDYTLPKHVERFMVSNFDVNTSAVYTGNKLDNDMSGSYAFSTLHGLGGDDWLYITGAYGGAAFGGKGNDSLYTAIGTMTGGPGADSFVLTTPGIRAGTPTIADFNPAQGDTIQFLRTGPIPTHEELVASGALRFDANTSSLILDMADELFGDQVVQLLGVRSLDLDLVTVGSAV